MGLGSRIQLCLEARRWSQSDLVRNVAGLDRSNLSALIRRDAKRSAYAGEIARVLGCEPSWLLTGEGKQWRNEMIEEADGHYSLADADKPPSDDCLLQRLLALFNQLPSHEKQSVVDHAEQRLQVCEQVLQDMLLIKGLQVVSKKDSAD